MYTNKYPGFCSNKACGVRLNPGDGFVKKNEHGKYISYCKNCFPERISLNSRREITEDFKVFTPYEPENLPLIKSLPKAKWNPQEKCWSISDNLADRERILEVADLIGLKVPDSIRIDSKKEVKLDIDTSGLYPFQIQGSIFCSKKDRCLLGDEMGLGKSVQALASLPANAAAIVICRAGIKFNWLDEVAKWRPDLKPSVVSGRDNFYWPENGEIVIINHDILPKEFEAPSKLKGETKSAYAERLRVFRRELKSSHQKSEETFLIVDEAHDFKSFSSQRTKKVKEICRLVKKVIGLTGSPLTNKPQDLYCVFDALGLAGETFGSYSRFKDLYNATDEIVNRHGQTKTVWGLPKPVVPELLKRVMLRRLRSEVLPDLPQKTYTNLYVGIDSPLKKTMDDLWDDWEEELSSNNLPPFSCFSEIRKELAHSRIPAMLEFIEDAEDQNIPLVIFSSHLSPLDALLLRPGWAVISGDTPPEARQKIVRAFQNNSLKGVGVSIRAGGVGITLTNAWKALFVDLDWTPASNWQAEDRIARIGQKSQKVEIVRMVSNHPLDLHVHKLLSQKIEVFQQSIDAKVKGKKFDTKEESEEEFQERVKNTLQKCQALEKENIKSKVKKIHAREKARAKSLVGLTPEKVPLIRQAFKNMLSVCDGAVSLDGIGFNKPDAVLAHWVLSSGLEEPFEIETALMMLLRYPKQVKKAFSALFE